MATVKDVAREAGVGIGTVSRVLNNNGYVSKEVEDRIRGAIQKLGYVPNQIARSFKRQKADTVAVLLPTVFHPFFSKITYYLESMLSAYGYRTLVVDTQSDKEKEVEMLEIIKRNLVDGIIFITHHEHDDIDEEMSLVSIDRHLSAGTPFITSDNYAGSRLALQYLLDKGCRRIGCICGKTHVPSEVAQRYHAYEDLAEERGFPVKLSLEEFQHGQERAVVDRFLHANPDLDGLFLGSDLLANAAYYSALDMGCKIPEDFQIVGFDGVLAEWLPYPAISTVCQNVEEMARRAVDVLMCRINGRPYEIKSVVPVEFHPGSTTK